MDSVNKFYFVAEATLEIFFDKFRCTEAVQYDGP
jgi:hypothetical protein